MYVKLPTSKFCPHLQIPDADSLRSCIEEIDVAIGYALVNTFPFAHPGFRAARADAIQLLTELATALAVSS